MLLEADDRAHFSEIQLQLAVSNMGHDLMAVAAQCQMKPGGQ